MINITKGQSNTFITTLSERLVNFGLTATSGQTFYFKLVNDLSQAETDFSLVDTSSFWIRANKFTLNEPDYNLVTGSYKYSAYADSGQTQSLESGKLVVLGTNSGNSLYW